MSKENKKRVVLIEKTHTFEDDLKTPTMGQIFSRLAESIEDFYSSRPSRLEYNTEMNQFYYAHESEKEGEHGYETVATAPHHLCHYFVHMVGDLQREGLLKKHMTAEEMHSVWLSIVGMFPTPTKMSDQFIERNFEVRFL